MRRVKFESLFLFYVFNWRELHVAGSLLLTILIRCLFKIYQTLFFITSIIICPCVIECFSFHSIDKVPKVISPVLVIHGTKDEVIDYSHGEAIYERCPRAVEPLWVQVSHDLKH